MSWWPGTHPALLCSALSPAGHVRLQDGLPLGLRDVLPKASVKQTKAFNRQLKQTFEKCDDDGSGAPYSVCRIVCRPSQAAACLPLCSASRMQGRAYCACVRVRSFVQQ